MSMLLAEIALKYFRLSSLRTEGGNSHEDGRESRSARKRGHCHDLS